MFFRRSVLVGLVVLCVLAGLSQSPRSLTTVLAAEGTTAATAEASMVSRIIVMAVRSKYSYFAYLAPDGSSANFSLRQPYLDTIPANIVNTFRSPDGKQRVTLTMQSNNLTIEVANADGSNKQILAALTGNFVPIPAFSPDNKQLLM